MTYSLIVGLKGRVTFSSQKLEWISLATQSHTNKIKCQNLTKETFQTSLLALLCCYLYVNPSRSSRFRELFAT